MDFVINLLVALHMLGLAAIIGPFLLFMGKRSGFSMTWVFIGAITQLVTGILLVGVHEMIDTELNHVKIAVKLAVAIIAFVGALVGWLRLRKVPATGAPEGAERAAVMPWLHIAGGFAVINVLVATLWK